MSNTDTATQGPNVIHDVDFAHRVADIEDSIRTDIKNGNIDFLGRTVHKYVYVKDTCEELRARAYDDVQASDSRIAYIWEKLWDALAGDVEQDTTWELIMDAIPGVPDLRVKTYSGVVTLKFYFSDVKVSGNPGRYGLEQAILDEIEGDLQYGYEDEVEVDYEEE